MALIDVDDLRDALHLDETATPDAALQPIVDAANELVERMLTTGDHSTHAWDKEAALAIAGQILQQRTSPGGSMVDFDQATVTPYLLGRGLMSRVEALITPCRNVRSMVG